MGMINDVVQVSVVIAVAYQTVDLYEDIRAYQIGAHGGKVDINGAIPVPVDAGGFPAVWQPVPVGIRGVWATAHAGAVVTVTVAHAERYGPPGRSKSVERTRSENGVSTSSPVKDQVKPGHDPAAQRRAGFHT